MKSLKNPKWLVPKGSYKTCAVCGGTGKWWPNKICPKCNGKGEVIETESYNNHIEPTNGSPAESASTG